jgi:hypothetical protein
VNKAEFKALVKECLIEILNEGIGIQRSTPMQSTYQLKSRPAQVTQNPNAARADRVSMMPQLTDSNNRQVSEAKRPVQQKSAPAKNDIFASILEDTRKTTLKTLNEYGDNNPHGEPDHKIQQVEQFAGTPESVFGASEAAKWADLAFMGNKRLSCVELIRISPI